MSCQIKVKEYIFIIKKMSRNSLDRSDYYVFIGDVQNDIKRILRKLENRETILKSEVILLKNSYKKYYQTWIDIVKNKNYIKFIYTRINMDDSINETKMKIFVYLSNDAKNIYYLPPNQELWFLNDNPGQKSKIHQKYILLGDTNSNVPHLFDKKSVNTNFNQSNANNYSNNSGERDKNKSKKLKKYVSNNSLLIDVLNKYHLKTFIIHMSDAIDEMNVLKAKGVEINSNLVNTYFKKYWTNVLLDFKLRDVTTSYLLEKNNIEKQNVIDSIIHNSVVNKNLFGSCNILVIGLTTDTKEFSNVDGLNSNNMNKKNGDADKGDADNNEDDNNIEETNKIRNALEKHRMIREEAADLYNIFDYMRAEKIGPNIPFIKYMDGLFNSPFTLVSKEAIETGTLNKDLLESWLGITKPEMRRFYGIYVKKIYNEINSEKNGKTEQRYSTIIIKKNGTINLYMSFKGDDNVSFDEVQLSVDDCKKMIHDINKNMTIITKTKQLLKPPDIEYGQSSDIEKNRTLVLKNNTKIIYMNLQIPIYGGKKIDFNKLLEFSRNFPNYLSEFPKEVAKKNGEEKSRKEIGEKISLKLKYNRVSNFANMNEVMQFIDLLKQKGVNNIVIIKSIEKKFNKSMEEAKKYLIEWTKKFGSGKTKSTKSQHFSNGVSILINNNNIELKGVTKIYQVPIIYKFITAFMNMYFNYDKLMANKELRRIFKTDKNGKGYNKNDFDTGFSLNKESNSSATAASSTNNLNIDLQTYENLNINTNTAGLDINLDLDTLIEQTNEERAINKNFIGDSMEISASNSEMDGNKNNIPNINRYFRDKGLALDSQIQPEARLSCEDKIPEKDTCTDLCNDKKYFLRRLQRYDINLFKDSDRVKNKDKKQYSRQCQPVDRQPIILPYDPEGNGTIKRESFTYSIKYSSNPEKLKRWYICPKIWCPYCEIPILDTDIDKSTIKKRTTKNDGGMCKTAKCPYGNHQVFVRDGDAHFPGFQNPADNPKGYCMPCCFKLSVKDPKYKSHHIYKKCMGDSSSNNMINKDDSQVYILGKGIPLENNRYGKLSVELAYLLNTKLETGYLEGQKGFLRKGIKQDKHNSFLAAICNVLSCDSKNKLIEVDTLKKILLEKLDDKMFRSLHGGNLQILFKDKTKNTSPIDNFKKYFMNEKNVITHKYLWDFLQRPNILFQKGINIIIFSNNQILCPFGENISEYYSLDRDTILLENKYNYYEPIYYVEGIEREYSRGKARVVKEKMAITTCIFSSTKFEIRKILDESMNGCKTKFDINWDEVLKQNMSRYGFKIDNLRDNLGDDLQTVLNELLVAIQNRKLENEYLPEMQYIDSYNKVYGIILKNGLYVPVNPSKLNTGLNYKEVYDIQDEKRSFISLKQTIEHFRHISKKTGLELEITNKILDLNGKNTIVAVVNQQNRIIPIIQNKNIDDRILKPSSINFFADADMALYSKVIVIDRRIDQINRKKYEDETFQRMRFELAKYLQLRKNKLYFDQIKTIIYNIDNRNYLQNSHNNHNNHNNYNIKNNTSFQINKFREELYKILDKLFKELISFKSNNVDYNDYVSPNNRMPCHLRNIKSSSKKTNKTKNLNNSDNLFNTNDNGEILSFKQSYSLSCLDDPHCTIDNGHCKLFVNRINLLDIRKATTNYNVYVSMITEEILRYKLKRLEIIEDSVITIIDKEKITQNPNKYIIIHNMGIDEIYRQVEELYRDKNLLFMDTKELYEEEETKNYDFDKTKFLVKATLLSSNSVLYEDISVYWEKFLGRNFKVKLNKDNKSIFTVFYMILNYNVQSNNNIIPLKDIKARFNEIIFKYEEDVIHKVKRLADYTEKNATNQSYSTILNLYKRELGNNLKLITSDTALAYEILSNDYLGCLIDIIYFSYIYNINIIVLDKRIKKDANGFLVIGPTFGEFDKYIILYKSYLLEKNIYTYGLVESKRKFVFVKKDFPQKFVKLLKL